jgi:pimeloyl-ACP methyl ester carboxylesterase
MRTVFLKRFLFLGLLAGFLSLRGLAQGFPAAGTSAPQAGVLAPVHPRVIVFVHGLHGDRTSWRAANGAYWPDMVKSDPRFAYSDVVVAEYPSPASNGKMSSTQLADTLWNGLRQQHVWEHREVVFVAHSLGGILVEAMLLRHPADAAKVRFVVSYGTPHEGSTVARVASLYDKDPLLNDLSDAGDNAFLTHLEDRWRSSPAVNGIHRFCAYEDQDTVADEGFIRYLKPHTRVVSYFSATYGCDVTTPPQEIPADHIHMIKPADRNAPAYDFFRRVYHDNPILEDQIVTRDNLIGGLTAGCDQTNANTDLQVPVALDYALHERVISATAALIEAVDIRDISPNPPAVTRIDPNGVAHVNYSFKGPKKLLVCLANGRASLNVEFSIDQQVPVREPGS